MTDPTGRSFLSYKRSRRDEAALLIQAQHDHGIPTWQDVHDLVSVPTEDELRRVLADPTTASAVLFITPEVENSTVIREVEVPKIVQRAEARDGFFVVPVAAGGLDFAKAAEATSNHLSAQNLADWNMHKVPASAISPGHAAEIANRALVQRIAAIHRHLPPGQPLRVGLFVRRPPPFEPGTALALRLVGPLCRQGGGARDMARRCFFPPLSASPWRSASMRRDARSKLSGCRPCRPRRRSAAPFSRQAACAPRGARLRRDAMTSSGH